NKFTTRMMKLPNVLLTTVTESRTSRSPLGNRGAVLLLLIRVLSVVYVMVVEIMNIAACMGVFLVG
ncbi:hypothetical protein COLO4_02796, partial [Corchorus olitorius]